MTMASVVSPEKPNGVANVEANAEDEQASPYASPPVTVCVGVSAVPYTFLQAIINQHPGLKARLNPKKPDAPILLPEVDEDVAHTFVHYLYTEKYQKLGLGSVPDDVKATAEFRRSVLVYCAARACGIDKLELTAKEKMEDFSKQLSLDDIKRVVEEVSPKLPQNDIWFAEHLYRWIKDGLKADDSLLTEGHILDVIGNNELFNRAVVKGIAELYSEKVAELKHTTASNVSRSIPTEVPVTNGINGSKALSDNTEEQSVVQAQHDSVHQVAADKVNKSKETASDHGYYSQTNSESGSREVQAQINADGTQSTASHVVEQPAPTLAFTDTSAKPFSLETPYVVEQTRKETPQAPAVDASPRLVKGDDSINVDSSKATDSEVEAAREKAAKKKKNKKNKKTTF